MEGGGRWYNGGRTARLISIGAGQITRTGSVPRLESCSWGTIGFIDWPPAVTRCYEWRSRTGAGIELTRDMAVLEWEMRVINIDWVWARTLVQRETRWLIITECTSLQKIVTMISTVITVLSRMQAPGGTNTVTTPTSTVVTLATRWTPKGSTGKGGRVTDFLWEDRQWWCEPHHRIVNLTLSSKSLLLGSWGRTFRIFFWNFVWILVMLIFENRSATVLSWRP